MQIKYFYYELWQSKLLIVLAVLIFFFFTEFTILVSWLKLFPAFCGDGFCDVRGVVLSTRSIVCKINQL